MPEQNELEVAVHALEQLAIWGHGSRKRDRIMVHDYAETALEKIDRILEGATELESVPDHNITEQVCALLGVQNAADIAALLWRYLPDDIELGGESEPSMSAVNALGDALIETFEELRPPSYRGDVDLGDFIGAKGGE